MVTKRLYGKDRKWSRGQKKTCRKKQHVKIDDIKEMSDLICGKAAVGGNYNSTRDSMYACRWGGEEFLLVFDRMNGDQAFPNLHSILNEIRNLKFNIGDRSFSITMTMGLAEYDFKSDADTIIKQADEKMYSGKENGRNQIVF